MKKQKQVLQISQFIVVLVSTGPYMVNFATKQTNQFSTNSWNLGASFNVNSRKIKKNQVDIFLKKSIFLNFLL